MVLISQPAGHMALDRRETHGTEGLTKNLPCPTFQHTNIQPRVSKYMDDPLGFQSISFHSAYNRHDAVHQKLLCSEHTETEEKLVRRALNDRLSEVNHAHQSLYKEIDDLWETFNSTLDCLRTLQKHTESLDRVLNINAECQRMRGGIPLAPERFDFVGGHVKEEFTAIMNIIKEFEGIEAELDDSLKTMKCIRERMMDDDKCKTMNSLITKSCLHHKPLFMPAPEVQDMTYLKNGLVEDWEQGLDESLQQAMCERHRSFNLCRKAENFMCASFARLNDTWRDTNNAFMEEIEKDLQHKDRMHALLLEVINNVNMTDERLSSLKHTQGTQDVSLHLQKWRQSRMLLRPQSEICNDEIVNNLEKAIRNNIHRLYTIRDLLQSTVDQYKDLGTWQVRLNREHEVVSKKIHIEKDLCLGLRNTVHIRRPEFSLTTGIPITSQTISNHGVQGWTYEIYPPTQML